MKNYYLIIGLLYFFASCGEKSPNITETALDTCVVKYNIQNYYSKPLSDMVDSIKSGEFLVKRLSAYQTIVYVSQDSNIIWDDSLIYKATEAAFVYEKERERTIDIKYQGQVRLYEYDNVLDLYLVGFKYATLDKIYRCFIDKKERKMFYIDIYRHYFVKVDPNSELVFLGGLQGMRWSGWDFDLVKLNPPYEPYFSTSNICDSINQIGGGIDVYGGGGKTCLSIKNGELKYENKDLNNDGLLDIRFSGWRMQYCPEHNWDLVSRTEKDTLIDSIPIVLDFIAYQNRAKQYRWRYIDKNCNTKLTTMD